MSAAGFALERLQAPEEVKHVLRRASELLAQVGVRSAILTGSAARGELSYAYEAGSFVLRSDIEVYVVTDNPARARRTIRPAIVPLERELRESWPGFHLETAFLSLRQLQTLPPYIRHFELKRNGVTLVGEPLLDLIPAVDAENLDWRELNDTILWRLATLLAAIPTSWVAGTAPLERGRAHAVVRSLLDVPLWALPGLGVLLPNCAGRVDHWGDDAVRTAIRDTPLPDGELLRACVESRRQTSIDLDVDALFATAVRSWCWAYGVATGEIRWGHAGAGLGFSTHDPLRRLRFAMRSMLRHRALVRPTVEMGYARPAADAAKGLIAAAAMLRDGRDAAALIDSTADALGARVRGADPVAAWAAARRSLLEYLDTVLGRREWEWRVAENTDTCPGT